MALFDTDYIVTLFLTCDLDTEIYQNRFYYRAGSNLGTANDLLLALEADLIPDLQTILHNSMNFVRLEAENAVDSTDFDSISLIQTGSVAGEALPRFNAWGFVLERSDTNFRSGGKRFGRISEGNVKDGEADPTFITTLNQVADELHAPKVGTLETYEPMLGKGVKVPNIGDPSKFHYELDSLSQMRGARYQRVTTQNSRK